MKKILTSILTLVLGIVVFSGCSNATINLSDAYDFLDNSSDTYIKVRKEHGYIGVEPGSLNNVYYSENTDDISTILSKLDQKVEQVDNQMMTPGGFYLEYRFYINEESYDEICITNNLIRYKDAYYLLNDSYNIDLKSNENQIYSFVTFDDNCKVYKDNEYQEDFNKVNELEFIKTNAINKDPIITIDCNGFKLYILSENEFYKETSDAKVPYEYFKIVGHIDFSSII